MPDTFDKLTDESGEVPKKVILEGGGAPLEIDTTSPLKISGAPEYDPAVEETGVGDGTFEHIVQMEDASRLDFLLGILANPSSAVVEFTVLAELYTGIFSDVTNDLYGVVSFSSAILGDTFGQFGLDTGGYTKGFRSLKFVVNITGATNDVDYVIQTKKTTI